MTNNYPNGQLNAEDEGELAIRFSHENGVVRIDFGKPVSWIGFAPQQAIDLALLLVHHAKAVGNSPAASDKKRH